MFVKTWLIYLMYFILRPAVNIYCAAIADKEAPCLILSLYANRTMLLQAAQCVIDYRWDLKC